MAGEFKVVSYEVNEDLDIKSSRTLDGRHDIYIFGKTSKTQRLYTVQPVGDSCVFITASNKLDCDEYYAIYEKDTNIKTLVSYNLQESRAQMWMEHYPDLVKNMPKELVKNLARESKTRKFADYLNGVMDSWV